MPGDEIEVPKELREFMFEEAEETILGQKLFLVRNFSAETVFGQTFFSAEIIFGQKLWSTPKKFSTEKNLDDLFGDEVVVSASFDEDPGPLALLLARS